MRTKHFFTLLFLMLFFSAGIFAQVSSTQPSGSGTSDDPYEISSLENLSWLVQNSNEWDKYYEQTTDIDASQTQYWDDNDANGDGDLYNDTNDGNDNGNNEGFSPIGEDGNEFTGTYDGQNNAIDNLYINRSTNDNIGLFGFVSDGSISNLNISNADITGDQFTGVLCGKVDVDVSSSSIDNCETSGSLSATAQCGGMIGGGDCEITNSNSSVTVTAGKKDDWSDAGGLIGDAEGTITNCYATGDVTAEGRNAGGLVGWVQEVLIIEQSYATGNVTIINTSSTSPSGEAGGLVGSYSFSNSQIINSYATGNISVDYSDNGGVGGLIGQLSNDPLIENCYSSGEVTNTSGNIGGLIGEFENDSDAPTLTDNFWDNEINSSLNDGIGNDSDNGVTGKTTTEMQDVATFTSTSTTGLTSAWDFVTNPNDDVANDDYWDMDQEGTVNNSYPILSWQDGADDVLQKYSGGSGTSDDPYEIATAEDLIELSNTSSDWNKYFIQTADISFNSDQTQVDWDGDGTADWDTEDQKGFSSIGNGSTYFDGTYDGQDNNINNLYIDRSTEFVALFGYTYGATLSNVNITNADITAGQRSGVLAGYLDNSSVVSNCFTSGNISATNYSGGLIGQIQGGCNVSNSHTSVDMTGTYGIGGFSGTASRGPRVENCYSTGNVVSTDANLSSSVGVGGFMGDTYSYNNTDSQTEIVNCYSKGNVTMKYYETGENIGSFIGDNTGNSSEGTLVKNSYATGQVIYKTASNPTDKGFIGSDDGSGIFTDNFFDEDVNQQISGLGATPKTTSEMKDESTFTDWTFNADNWAMSDGNSRPYLAWQNVAVDNSYPDVGVTSVDFPEGNIHNNSGASLTLTYGYIYEQDALPSWENSPKKEVGTNVSVIDGADQTIAATTISSLTEGTSYYVRSYTTDGSTVWYGETVQFTTSTISSMTWDGSESSDWNTAGNWSGNVTPDNTHNVTIPSDVPNDPVISDGDEADCHDLTVESGATLTVNDGGSLITNGTVTNNGTVDIKMNATAGQWNLVAIPTTTETANVFYDNYLQKWNETTAGWEEITDENTSLTPVKGYSLWPPASKNSFTFSGTPNNGNQSIAISHTNNGSDNEGANLVGNPYPSYLDWDQVSGYGAKYTWDGTAYNAYTDVEDYGSGTRDVAPMEGFFIITDSDGTFSLNNSMRTHKLSPSKSGEAKSLSNGLVLSASNGSYEDEFWLVFNDQASESFELQRDAWKLLSSTEGLSQLYSFSPDGKMSIDVRPMTNEIQLGFQNNQPGTYSIGLKEIADLQKAVLEDTKEEVFHDLTESNYEFAWKTIDSETRFKLHLNTVGIEDEINNESQDLLIYAKGQNIYLKTKENPGEMDVRVRDITGRTLLQKQVNGSGTSTIPTDLQTGVYVVEVMQNQERTTKKVMIRE